MAAAFDVTSTNPVLIDVPPKLCVYAEANRNRTHVRFVPSIRRDLKYIIRQLKEKHKNVIGKILTELKYTDPTKLLVKYRHVRRNCSIELLETWRETWSVKLADIGKCYKIINTCET